MHQLEDDGVTTGIFECGLAPARDIYSWLVLVLVLVRLLMKMAAPPNDSDSISSQLQSLAAAFRVKRQSLRARFIARTYVARLSSKKSCVCARAAR